MQIEIFSQDAVQQLVAKFSSEPFEVVVHKPEPPKGKLPATVLAGVVSTRLSKTDLRDVLVEIGRQVGITIEIHESVPRYKVDAFLIKTSLKYALDVLAKATGTRYDFTDRRTILLSPMKEESRVSIVEY